VRYRDLKEQRDAAIARAIEAERLSMKDEVDRIRAELEAEKAALNAIIGELLPVVEAAAAACEGQESGLRERAWQTWSELDKSVSVYRARTIVAMRDNGASPGQLPHYRVLPWRR